jgi:hypothetical protein
MADDIELTLLVGQPDADAEELDRTTRRLRTELKDLSVESVSLSTAGQLPAGAKGADAVTLGALTISLAPVVIPPLIELLKSWMGRKEGRTVVIRKTVGDTSTEIEIKSALSDSAIAALVKGLSPQG